MIRVNEIDSFLPSFLSLSVMAYSQWTSLKQTTEDEVVCTKKDMTRAQSKPGLRIAKSAD